MSEVKFLAQSIYEHLPEQVSVDDGITREAGIMSKDIGLGIVDCQRVLLSIRRANAFLSVFHFKYPVEEQYPNTDGTGELGMGSDSPELMGDL